MSAPFSVVVLCAHGAETGDPCPECCREWGGRAHILKVLKIDARMQNLITLAKELEIPRWTPPVPRSPFSCGCGHKFERLAELAEARP